MSESMVSFDREKERPYNRMPITIEIDGHPENVWTKYQLGHETIISDCHNCGKKDQKIEIQKPENIEVETDNPEIKRLVLEKLLHLVRTVEERMSVCHDCFDDDFLTKRAELYITTLKQVQKEMGINVNFERQREKIIDK